MDRLVRFASHPPSQNLIAQEVLDSHLRSLMPGHIADVQSVGPAYRQAVVRRQAGFFAARCRFRATRISANRRPAGFGERSNSRGSGLPAGASISSTPMSGHPLARPIHQSQQPRCRATTFCTGRHAGLEWWLASDLNSQELDGLANRLTSNPRPLSAKRKSNLPLPPAPDRDPSPVDVAVPRERNEGDADPEHRDARAILWMHSPNINDNGQQPESAFHDQRRGNGIPKTEAQRRDPQAQVAYPACG